MRIQPFSIGGPLIGSTCLARSVIGVVEERILVTERCFPGRLKGWAESRASCPWKKSSSCDPARYSDRPYSSVAPLILGSSAESVGKKPVRTGLYPEPRGFGRHGTGMLMLPFGRIPKRAASQAFLASFPMWLQVFQLADSDKMEILSPQRDTMTSCRHKETRWNLVATRDTMEILSPQRDTMKSCRHKATLASNLQLVPSRRRVLIGRRRGTQRQGETDLQKSLWFDNAARHQNRTVSPDGKPTRARNIPQILLGWLIVSCWATGPRIRHVEKVPLRPSFLTALLSPTEDARRGPALGRGHRQEQPTAPPPSHPPRTIHRRRSGDAGSSPAARSPLSSARA